MSDLTYISNTQIKNYASIEDLKVAIIKTLARWFPNHYVFNEHALESWFKTDATNVDILYGNTFQFELSVYGDGIIENLERSIILINTDRIWREHLQKMSLLREAVGWRGYGQKNPLYEYKQDAFTMFENREEILRHLVVYDLLRASIL